MPYTKSFTDGASSLLSYHAVLASGTPISGVHSYSTQWLSRKDGEYNPRWKYFVAHDLPAGTIFSGTDSHVKASNISYTRTYTPLGVSTFGFRSRSWLMSVSIQPPSSGVGFPTLPMTDAINEAKTKFVNSVRKHQTQFQGGVFAGELGEALRMLRSPAKTLRRGFDDYLSKLKKVKRIERPIARRKILADTWLEYSFGWRPLIKDIDDAMEAVASAGSHPQSKRVYSKAERKARTNSIQGIQSIPHSTSVPNPGTINGFLESEVQVKYLGSAAAVSELAGGFNTVGLDLSNWAPTAWELIPWSFAADYFTNIGNIISAASLARSSLRWHIQTIRTFYRKVPVSYTSTYGGTDSDAFSFKSGSSFSPGISELKYVTRDPQPVSLVPTLDFKLPFSNLQWLNLAALGASSRRLVPFF